MKEYIERETLKILFAGACAECRDSCAEFDGIEADCNQCILNGVIRDAKSIPAADVRLARRGKWKPSMCGTANGPIQDRDEWYGPLFLCSECGADMIGASNFCPNCGADMRRKTHENV